MPAAAFTSADVFDWERSEIFDRTWVCLGRTDDLLAPGQVRGVDHGAESILLTRDVDGTVRGFSNVCRHRGHTLVEPGEAIDARLVRCPYHSWSYRFDGSLRSAPTLTQPSIMGTGDFDTEDWPLSAVGVDDLMGWLFLDLSGEAPPLGHTYGGLADLFAPYEPGRLSMVARHAYEVAANWKLIVENYHECYHCSTIHPELCQVSPPDSGRDIEPGGLWCGGEMELKDHAVTMSLTGASEGRNFRRLDADQARKVVYVGLWPNLLISAHPDYVMTHRIVPLGPGRSFVECDWLFAPESLELDGFDPAYAVDFWDITNREDWNACEHVQKGAANRGFAPGPLSPWESTLHQFHSMVAAAYRGGPVTRLESRQHPVRGRRQLTPCPPRRSPSGDRSAGCRGGRRRRPLTERDPALRWSAGLAHIPPHRLGGGGHPCVVRHQAGERVSEQVGRGEMDGVQGAKCGGAEPARSGEHTIVDPDQIQAGPAPRSARRRPTSPTWIIARATSALARALDTSTRRRLRKRRRAGDSDSRTTSLTIADESR